MDEATHDELAGVVDLFGAMTRAELEEALVELAFRRRQDVDEDAVAAAVEEALADYYLVATDHDGEAPAPLLLPGPVAFPTLPDGAEDLPHILDVPDRDVDQESVAAEAADRLRSDVDDAVADGDEARLRHLREVTYDLESWAGVDLTDVRNRLDEAL